jgi:uncharacterized membrane protein
MHLNNSVFAIADSTESPELLGLTGWGEALLNQMVFGLELFFEAIALVILTIAALRALRRLVSNRYRMQPRNLTTIRLDLGLALGLSLEFLLAADIASTAVSPDWDAIGRLAAITTIRTFLNFFLQREVKDLEIQTHSSIRPQTDPPEKMASNSNPSENS